MSVIYFPSCSKYGSKMFDNVHVDNKKTAGKVLTFLTLTINL